MMITLADLADAEVRDLIAYHQRAMVEGSPPGHSFALDLTGLQAADVTLWAAHVETRVAAIGALKRLDDAWGEIKSMRTHPDVLRRGVGARLLEHVIGVARSRGMRRLSLETGTAAAFEPALALYRRRGFVDGEIFGGYAPSPFNRFMHLSLRPAGEPEGRA